MIIHFFNESEQTYGYRRIHAELARHGVAVDPGTVREIMRDQGLVSCHPCPKIRTTVPAADRDSRPDLVHREFTASAPGVVWMGDITYIHTWEGFVYLATVIDCYSRKVVGYALDCQMPAALVCRALDMAVRTCPPTPGVTIFHSDRGAQYTSAAFADVMAGHQIVASVGRTGSCYDNAAAESFNASLKKEKVNRVVYPTTRKAIRDVTSWIELRYNQKRLHSTLGYKTPNEADRQWRTDNKAA